jgi:hypothetical protein
MQHTIESLRRGGYKIRVHHGLTENLETCEKNIREAASHYTHIEITDTQSWRSVEGWAYCSRKDNWNRKLGNRIALSRAVDKLEKIKVNESLDYMYNPAVTFLSFAPDTGNFAISSDYDFTITNN